MGFAINGNSRFLKILLSDCNKRSFCVFSSGDTSFYRALLDAWCPEYGHVKVYLTDSGDEAVLLHEWLRLRMIRSQVPRVVDAGKTHEGLVSFDQLLKVD